MAVSVYIRSKRVPLGEPDTIPDLDDKQLDAGEAMARDGNKLLFSDPGAGKTLTALHAMMLVDEQLDDDRDRPTLFAVVICPPIAVRTWMRWIYAAYTFADRHAVIQIIDKGSDQIRVDATHVILTYGIASQKKKAPVVDDLRRCRFNVFIADESDNLAGTQSNRSVTVFGHNFRKGVDALCHFAEWCWMLTGTAIPRHNDGVYPVLRALFPHKLNRKLVNRVGVEYDPIKTEADFRFVFCKTRLVKFGNMRDPVEEVCGSRNEDLLNSILYGGANPICIRLKSPVKDPPIFREVLVRPKFSKEFLKLEQELEEAPKQDNQGNALVDARLATAQRLMGEECAPEVAKHVLNEFKLDRNRGVTLGKVVLHVHTEAGRRLVNAFIKAGYRVRFINGSTDRNEDNETERRFNAGECDIVVGQIVAMGVAISLQEHCDHVIFAEETSSDARNLQAYMRVWRRGQTRKVRVDFCRPLSFLADSKVNTAERKAENARRVLDG